MALAPERMDHKGIIEEMLRPSGPTFLVKFPMLPMEKVKVLLRSPDSVRSLPNLHEAGLTHILSKKVKAFQASGILKLTLESTDSVCRQLQVRVKPPEKMIHVAPSEIIFPEASVGSKLHGELVIRNRSCELLHLSVQVSGHPAASLAMEDGQADSLAKSASQALQPIVTVSPSSPCLEPHGATTLKVTVEPRRPGKQTSSVIVKSQLCGTGTRVDMTMSPQKLKLIELVEPSDDCVADLGHCYLNSANALNTVPFRVKNLTDDNLHVAFRSNLVKQAFVSQDSGGAHRLEGRVLDKKETGLFFLCLRPGGDAATYDSGLCREIVGGMRLVAQVLRQQGSSEPGSNQVREVGPTDELTIRFRAMVGKSLMRVSTSSVDLGVVSGVGGTIAGCFTIYNLTKQMPLKAALSAQVARLSAQDIELSGAAAAESSTLKDHAEVEFRIPIRHFGLMQDKVLIQNLTCPGQVATVHLQLFVKQGSLAVSLPRGLASESRQEGVLYEEAVPGGREQKATHPSPGRVLRKVQKSKSFGEYLLHDTKEKLPRWMQPESVQQQAADEGLCEVNVLDVGAIHVYPLHAAADPPVVEYQVVDAGEVAQSFSVCNMSHTQLLLQPVSNFPLVKVSTQGGTVEGVNSDGDHSLPNGYAPCGSPFVLEEGRQASVYLQYCVHTGWVTASRRTRLDSGQSCAFEGSILFLLLPTSSELGHASTPTFYRNVLEMLEVRGSFCISTAQLIDSHIDLGDVGYTSGWQSKEFEVCVQNSSCVDFVFKLLELPHPFSVLKSSSVDQLHSVPPESVGKIQLSFDSSLYSDLAQTEVKTWVLRLANIFNPTNELMFEVAATLHVQKLIVHGLERNTLWLPSITFPPSPLAEPSGSTFLVENSSSHPLSVSVRFSAMEDISARIQVALELSPAMGSGSHEAVVSPYGFLDIQVVAWALSDVAPLSCAEVKGEDGMDGPAVCLGNIHLGAHSDSSTCVPVYCRLVQAVPFTVTTMSSLEHVVVQGPSCNSFEFGHKEATDGHVLSLTGSAELQPCFTVHNLKQHEDLHFEVTVKGESGGGRVSPGGSPAYKIIPMSGKIPPNRNCHVRILVLPVVGAREGSATPELLQLSVSDIHDPSRMSAYSILCHMSAIVESTRKGPLDSAVAVTGRQAQQRSLTAAILTLRGCTPVEGSSSCFGINLGQQKVSPQGITWDLVLECDAQQATPYRVSDLENESSWLRLSNSEGALLPGEQAVVSIHCSTDKLGILSTHLVIENPHNPLDFKTVQLALEVVATKRDSHVLKDDCMFRVHAPGNNKDEQLAVDMGVVYYKLWYRNRSFVIQNDAPVSMDFSLHSILPNSRDAEINFSLANTSLKGFNSVTVGANSSLRIWIHFYSGSSLREEGPAEDGSLEQLHGSILLNCRLIKDHQLTIPFRAKCHYPQIDIVGTDLVFSLKMQQPQGSSHAHCPGCSPGEASHTLPSTCVEFSPPVHSILLRNMAQSLELEYAIKNPSTFFLLLSPRVPCIPGAAAASCAQSDPPSGSSTHLVTVMPNLAAITDNLPFIMNNKYVEEHVTVYNRRSPCEKYVVSLRLTAGNLKSFCASPGPRKYHPFVGLEVCISNFLRDFNHFCSQHSVDVDGHASLPSHNLSRHGSDLLFELHYLTDELVYFGLKERWGRGGGGSLDLTTIQLAKLLYLGLFKKTVFSQWIKSLSALMASFSNRGNLSTWPQWDEKEVALFLKPWIGQLKHFLSFFPDPREELIPLTTVFSSLEATLSGSSISPV